MVYELERDGFLFSTRSDLLDLTTIHSFLTTSYWSPGIPLELVERAISNSIPFGVYERQQSSVTAKQVGFARIISDKASYAYLADVFILEAWRGRGLSKALMSFILAHPELQGLRRIALMTRDAHGLYRQFGFNHMDDPSRYMELLPVTSYARPQGP